ncbi:hypothetical protein [Listeria costaricensis]|uniref:hypothetical protein n=1 Tax=Listeria costaricensis TaxID=2026604 RepID=UPI000C079E54|nr:hypothetical protein [Listeria costaricensis]
MAKNPTNKKPIYKKWWFWLIVVVILIGAAANMGGDSDQAKETDKAAETKSSTKDDSSAKKQQTEKKKEKLPYPTTAKEVTLGAGTFIVGEDIEPGRYVIHTDEASGNITSGINLNEILGTDTSFAVNDIVTTLEKDQELQIQNLNAVTFTPKEAPEIASEPTETTFNSGLYYVGVDIPAGKYNVHTDDTSGNLTIGLKVNEILGTDPALAVNDVQVSLKDGDKIQLSGLSQTTFSPK